MSANGITDGIYLLRFKWLGTEYLRRVIVDGTCLPNGGLQGGYYRFVDENDNPLPDSISMSVSVAIKSGSTFEPADSRNQRPAGDVTAKFDAVNLILGPTDEVIRWYDAANSTPDDGMIVLLKCPDSPEPVWPGFLEDNTWHFVDASEVGFDVTFWADLPVGPLFDNGDDCEGVTADLPPDEPQPLARVVKMARPVA